VPRVGGGEEEEEISELNSSRGEEWSSSTVHITT